VTGAASGIGRGIAEGLAESEANVVLADINLEGAERAAAEIAQKSGARTLAVKVDVTSAADTTALAEKVKAEFGRIDILVNNAGIAPAFPLADFPEDRWDLAIDINLKGYFLCAKAVAPCMIEQGGGNIVNISSKTGVRGSGNNSAYNASKFGVIGLAQGWCRELAKHNIRANSVLPGNVLQGSGIWNDEYKKEAARKLGVKPDEVEDYYNRQVPLGRQCTVEDIANLVVFLVSDKASYITGTSMLVDGGQEMR
jgi:sorbitol-6-phosphate 2-dehydrogenase